MAAAKFLDAAKEKWNGTLICLFQPSEETASGAQAMVDDGLWNQEKYGIPVGIKNTTCSEISTNCWLDTRYCFGPTCSPSKIGTGYLKGRSSPNGNRLLPRPNLRKEWTCTLPPTLSCDEPPQYMRKILSRNHFSDFLPDLPSRPRS